MIRWGAWRAEAARTGGDAFVTRFGSPFLVVCEAIEAADVSLVETGRLPRLGARDAPVAPREDALVLPVQKAAHGGSVFPDMITVGRARNNDLVLPDERVSSFHAYFTLEGEVWHLRDGASSNGTYVRGVRIEEPTSLGADTWVGFAGVQCRFLLPAAMYDALIGRRT